MSSRILVTGGAGYIGSVLVPMLLEKGYDVRVFDKLYFGKEPLKEVLDDIELVQGDIRSFEPAVLKGIDSVIHMASLSNDPTGFFNQNATLDINVNGSMKVAEACRRHGIRCFTFASSCSVYGFNPDVVVDEEGETSPQSDYAQSKLDFDNKLLEMAGDDFCPVSLRQATVFGFSPRMRWDLVVNAFVMHAFRGGALEVWFGGEALRPLVHIKDTAEAHIRCLEAEPQKIKGQIFNVVNNNYRILDLAQQVKKKLEEIGIDVNLDINYDQIDPRSYRVDGSKITETLGFTPQITVEDGVKEIAEVLRTGRYRDFDNPIYYNVRWLKLLLDMETRLGNMGQVL